jgi:menaquinone-dependent protoporphyrinogen oxidase
MRTMIAYASKTGTAERCAAALAERIPGAMLFDLDKIKPDPSDYDQVIVGGSVRVGALNAAARGYLDGAKLALLKKPLGIFLCAGNDEGVDKVVENNIDAELRAHADSIASFGGDMRPEKFRGIEKFVVKMVLKAAKRDRAPMPQLHPERIDEFARLFGGA